MTGGRWESYYDGETVTDSSDLDIDHVIALAEAWDSGASSWSTQRREAFANDLGAEQSLVAVTASSNRSKSDRDPAEWLPPAETALCTYTTAWVATKLRWDLAVDAGEQATLENLAADCPDARVGYDPVR
ncbi:MAG: HNH endonuclease family protein [Thermocrispum sp.]